MTILLVQREVNAERGKWRGLGEAKKQVWARFLERRNFVVDEDRNPGISCD
jgi:hypothetical protein